MEKYKSLIAKCLKANARYEQLNNLRDKADDMDDIKTYRKLDRQCENAFDKYLDYFEQLPKYVQIHITKLHNL